MSAQATRLTGALALAWLAVCVSLSARAQPAAFDTPVSALRAAALKDAAPCELWRTVEHISRFARVPVGFEHVASCAPHGWGRTPEADAWVFDGLTPRQMFDRLVAARPDYAWKDIAGIVVLRPVMAWQDARNVLARSVVPFAVRNRHPHDLLHDIYQAARPSLFHPHEDARLSDDGEPLFEPPTLIDQHVDLTFAGGTLLQALNAITRKTGARWELGYWGRPHVALYAADFDGGTTGLSMLAQR